MHARCGTATLTLLFSLPVYSGDRNDGFIRAAQRGDLLVVSELFMTPTAALADYVLPAAQHYEKLGTSMQSVHHLNGFTRTTARDASACAHASMAAWTRRATSMSAFGDRSSPSSTTPRLT